MEVPGKDWLPVRAIWHGDRLDLAWLRFGDRPLVEPFFENDVRLRLSDPFNQLFARATPIDVLPERLARDPGLDPSGFIFHMSRCGSTLVSRMLAAVPDTLVVSEASPIDTLIQVWKARPDLQDQLVVWLRWLVATLGYARFGEGRYIVKLDSWHALALPLFRKAFASVPWVFLYRDPIEVMVSQMTMASPQMIPGMMPGLALDSTSCVEPVSYCARLLAAICEAALAHHSPAMADLIDYDSLPGAVRTIICPRFGIDEATFAASAAEDRTGTDAKTGAGAFVPDGATKKRMASDAIHRAVAMHLRDVHERFDTVRMNSLSRSSLSKPPMRSS